MAGAQIFISYRRDDTAGSARALYLVLRSWFGQDAVYYDRAGQQPGEKFRDRLGAAIAQARVVLAVIGKSWLDELNQRLPRQATEPDIVRAELEWALELQRQHPDTRWIVPVLMECDSMPARTGLAPALQAGLGGLWDHNACALGGEQQRWDQAVRGLLARLGDLLHLQPLPTAGDAQRIETARVAVRDLLGREGMEPLRGRWGTDPLCGLTPDRLEHHLETLGRNIHESQEDWRRMHLKSPACEAVKQACRDIVAACYGLAVDGSTARAWLEEPDCQRPVPVASAGALAFAHAAVHGLKAGISAAEARLDGFEPDDVVDLGLPDAGGTESRRAAVHRRMWRATFTDPRIEYPSGEGALSAEYRDTLRRRMAARARIHRRAYLATEVQVADGAPTDLQDIANELGMVALPRTGQDKGLLRVDERDFNAMVAEVLVCIERIPCA